MASQQLGPLGLLPSYTSQNRASIDPKLRLLEAFSLMRETQILAREEKVKMSTSLIPTLEREFKRFFALPLLFPDPMYDFAPTPPVDVIWHELIIDTRRYSKLSDDVYGSYVHHTPLSPGQASMNAGEILGYTKKRLVEAFGELTPSIWGEAQAGCDMRACHILCYR